MDKVLTLGLMVMFILVILYKTNEKEKGYTNGMMVVLTKDNGVKNE
jgi:hypothetical protein